ncbi:type III pantothenate kinase [Vulcanimicrobium alpinum]|uniref:Type III pantothenate kinase n=1 Tax=Vulcanimicrobium alpinum TaxID=3016050 RepID=A0AAN2CAY3_UNVUL|nr:type III pantothenate kinase [Vulcanimicrobium alpinum]BDE07616.1 type III pantothenate kinase [Vulcanimicrobium alpinum]
MLLCIDVGNTETKLGAFDRAGAILGTWRVTTARRRTPDEYGVLFAAFFSAAHFAIGDIEAIAVSSVVPSVDRPLAEGCEKYFGVVPSFFSAATQTSLIVRTERPREVGSDLIAAAIGAVAFVGTPAIAINFGTATTFGAIDRDGAYVGAAIATGLQVSLDALVGRTAKLPQVALVAPGVPVGRETVTSIQAGLIYGAVGQTEELVRRIRGMLGEDARVIASGGLAPVVAAETAVIERVEPHLVLHGLRLGHLHANGSAASG